MKYKVICVSFVLLMCTMLTICKNQESREDWWKSYLELEKSNYIAEEEMGKNIVGIIDSGIDISCEDIVDSVYVNPKEIPNNGLDDDKNGYVDDIHGWNFYDDSNEIYTTFSADYHGTMIAGILSSKKYGVSANIKFMPLKCFRGTEGSVEDIIEAIDYAYNLGVRIFNCSWDMLQYNEELYLKMSEYSDAIFVCASGKNQENLNLTKVYPACYDLKNIICVGACEENGNIYDYSGFGDQVDIYVPGKEIYCLMPENTYNYSEGTSLSVAMISGVCVLKKAFKSNISVEEIKSDFQTDGDNILITKISWEE